MQRETLLKSIEQAVSCLRQGGVILYPADTIWGIGCDPANQEAIKKVYEIKGRDYTKPLILLVSSIADVYSIAESVHPRIDTLLHLHVRPLTVLYPKTRSEFRHLSASDGSIGIRVVKEGFCHDLINAFGSPLISTSANRSGHASPVQFDSVDQHIISAVDYALPPSAERDLTGVPSVIARYDDQGELDFIRTAN